MPRRFLPLAILLSAATFLAACNGGESAANIVGFDDESDQPAVGVVVTADFDSASNGNDVVLGRTDSQEESVAPFTVEGVLDAAQAVSDHRDQILAGKADVTILEGLASLQVQSELTAAQTANLASVEALEPGGRVSFTTWVDFVEVFRHDDQIIGLSCSERWGERWSGEYNISFVDEAFVFDVVDGQLFLSEIRIGHDGEPTTEGLTCFSGIMGERAVDGARSGIEALDALFADPSLANRMAFEELFGGPALETIAPIATSIDQSRRRVTPVETRYTPLGVDPRSLDFLGKVAVCRSYPQGMYDEVISTGERVEAAAAYEPGTSVEDVVSVWIEPKRRSEGGVDLFFAIDPDVSRGCWS